MEGNSIDRDTYQTANDKITSYYNYPIRDKESDEHFKTISNLASNLTGKPFSTIVFSDDLFSCAGASELLQTSGLRQADFISDEVIKTGKALVVEDVESSPYADKPSVKPTLLLRFFAGVPLLTAEGVCIGALTVLDTQPSRVSEDQLVNMELLAELVVGFLELHRKHQVLHQSFLKISKFQKLFDHSAELHCIANDEGEILYINDAVDDFLGYPKEYVKGRVLWDFCIPGTRERLMPRVWEELSEGKSQFVFEVEVITKDGEIKSIELSDSFVDGYWVINGRNITERRNIEKTNKYLNAAIGNSAVGVIIRDADGLVEWMNSRAEELTGYTLSELENRSLTMLLVKNSKELDAINYALERFKAGLSYQTEMDIQMKDGTPLWVFIANTPFYSEDGKMDRQVGILVDITQRKLAEEKLQVAMRHSEQIVKEKEAFLSVMSHELRTTINGIIGVARMLKLDRPQKWQMENLQILDFSSDNLLNLVNDILDYSKAETGNIVLESEVFNIHKLVTSIVQTLHYKIEGKSSLRLHYSIDPRIPQEVIGDRLRLYQILMNLGSNALKFTDKGFVKIAMRFIEQDEDTVSILFECADSGIGISGDKIETIFQPYVQAQSDISRKYGGTGLGLAIVKKLLKFYHSRITVKSEYGHGSVFSFPIKFNKKTEATVHSSDSPVFEPLRAKVLVVDDNAINRLVAQKAIAQWGVEVDVAEDGLKAIQLIKAIKYDLVLMDIHMPLMDGFEAVTAIRKFQGDYFSNLPIYALSSSVNELDRQHLYEVGMNGWQPKPFELVPLHRLIKRISSSTYHSSE